VCLVHRLSEVFDDVTEEEYVSHEIMIVVLFECLYAKEVPRCFGTFVLLLFERLIFQLVIKTIDRRELRFRKFLWPVM